VKKPRYSKGRKLTAEEARELAKRYGRPNPEAIGFLRGFLNAATPESLGMTPGPAADRGVKALRAMFGLFFGTCIPAKGIDVEGPAGQKIHIGPADGHVIASDALSAYTEVATEAWLKDSAKGKEKP